MPETLVSKRSEKHEMAASLFQQGDYDQAALWLSEALLEGVTGEKWNDWATAKFFGGHAAEAEGGYRRALDIEPGNVDAMTNLGALLAGQQRFSDAIPFLESVLATGPSENREKTLQLLKTCKDAVMRGSAPENVDIRRFCEIFSTGLSLQTVSLDRVLFRLMNVENRLREMPNQSVSSDRNLTNIDNQLRELARRCEGITEIAEIVRDLKERLTPAAAEVPHATEIAEGTIQELVEVQPEGQAVKTMYSSFYRGESCNFNPHAVDHELPAFCRDFILKGHLPASKIISKKTRITAFGSCFAQNITDHLSRLGFDLSKKRAQDIHISTIGEGLVNVYSLLQQFTWALEGEKPPDNLWHGFDAQSFGVDEDVRERTRDVFLNTDVFILTLGLSEIWFDEVTGGVLWRAVPMDSYDPGRHKFRVCSFAETKQAIERMFAVIVKHVPSAQVIFTLSPIPLAATFRPVSCITANYASKSILKAALDEFLRELDGEAQKKAYYFPAFEIIHELFPKRFIHDGRHLQPFVIPAVMKIFEAYYCQSDLPPEEAERELQAARRASLEMPPDLQR